MPDSLPDTDLANYRSLLSRVDQLCGEITGKFAEHITCRAGCSGCCRHLSLFPVEAANLLNAVNALPDEVRLLLTGRTLWSENGPCPLLLDGLCPVYRDRPVICRTHGLPLLMEAEGSRRIDCCPENFKKAGSLPGRAVINLETLNSTLVAINALFVAETNDENFQKNERFTIADIILLAADKEHP